MATNETDLIQATAAATTTPDETGQLDARFMLWRAFCTETGVDVETLPSELEGDLKKQWEAMKDTHLAAVREEVINAPVTTQS